MIKHTMALALTLTAVSLPAASNAATQIQSLDTNATWNVQNVTSSPLVAPFVANAVVPGTVPGTYNGGSGNPSTNGAKWIMPTSAANQNAETTWAFTKTFQLSGMTNLASAILSGKFWSDNGIVSIFLNNVAIFGPVSEASAGTAPISTFNGTGATMFAGTGNFVYGTNVLTFNVRNGIPGAAPNPVGFKGDLQVEAAIPEPGTWMLMLLGFAAIGFAMRSRAKTQVRFQFA